MSKKPANLIYGLDDRPPLWITFLLALQHISIFAISLLFPVVVIRDIGGHVHDAVRFVSASMLAGGVAVIAQSLKKGPVGSGYLCPEVCGPSYLAASILAAKTGGLPLVFGMTAVASIFEGMLSRIMRHLRMLFPAEVTGLIVMMVGLTVIKIASVNFFGLSEKGGSLSIPVFLTAILTLIIMIGLNVWGKGNFKLFCALIGMMAGYIISWLFGIFDFKSFTGEATFPLWASPFSNHPGWSFDITLLLPFVVAVICSTLKTVGDITTCQRINDSEWKRPDLENISKGILADSVGAFTGGLVGGFGQSSSSTNIGLSIATGSSSRVIGF